MAGQRRYRRRRSAAAGTVGDTAYIANRLSWRGAAALGLVLFALFYWGIPAALQYCLATLRDGVIKPLIEVWYYRRIHWFQWVGIALGLVCVFFALRNFLAEYRLSQAGEQSVSFWSRIVARWLD